MLPKRCQNLPAGHCVTVEQAVKAVSVPTCPALCNRGADSLRGVGTYLQGTVLLWCRLFKRCPNLPAGHCVAGVQTVKVVSEPNCRTLCYKVAGCLSGVRTYLPGTVLLGCRLIKRCQNLLAEHCVTVMQTF